MKKFTRAVRDFFTGRVFLSLLCLAVSCGAAFYGLPRLYKLQNATTIMPRVKQGLQLGDLIEPKHLEYVEIGSYNLPATAIVYQEDIIGKYTRIPMVPGDFVFPEKLSDFRVDPGLDHLLLGGKRLMTITPKGSAAAVAAHLKPGDTVALVTIREERTNNDVVRHYSYPIELSNLIVYDVENARGVSLARVASEEEILLSSGQSTQEDLVPRTITFIVDDAQAALLVAAEYGNGFHIIFKERAPS